MNDTDVATSTAVKSGSISQRRSHCVLCGSNDMSIVVALDPIPIATPNFRVGGEWDEHGSNAGVPLDIHQCAQCGHLQVGYLGNREMQYRNYVYTTSLSAGLTEHFQNYADALVTQLPLAPGSLVVELGSNDGTLLRAFGDRGMRVLGIDPAVQIARIAAAGGIPTLAEFFSSTLAHDVAAQYGRADLCVANNVIANIEDLGDIAAGVAALLAPGGVFIFETQYGADVIESRLLDTVYHEHISYFLLTPLIAFFDRHGLELYHAERIATKGGSFRAYVARREAGRTRTPQLTELLEREARLKMFEAPYFAQLNIALAQLRDELADLVAQARRAGRSVAGYGVSVGTTTLLAQFGLTDALDFLIDDDASKDPVLTGPGYRIPVYGSCTLAERRPALVIIFAWRYADAIVRRNADYLDAGGTFVIPLPQLSFVRGTPTP